MADDFFNSTKLLLLGNGTDGSTTFTDNSYTPKTVTAVGNAQIDTAIKKYGSGSMQFDGTGDYLSAGVAADWTFMHLLDAKWTFEAWVSVTDFVAARTLFCTSAGSWSFSGIYIGINATTRTVFFEVDRGVTSTNVLEGSFATALPNDTAFHHIAVTYDNSLATDNAALYIDGIFSGFLSKTAYAPSAAAPNTPARIGGYGTTGNFKGYIDDLRITNGVIRYTTNFIPPIEELPTTQTTVSATFALTAPLPTLTVHPGLTIALAAPSPTLAFYTGADVALTAPSPTLLANFGLQIDFTAPSPLLTFYAHDSTGENAANLTAPKPTLIAFTGAVSRLTAPSPTMSCSVTVTILATANLTAPSPTLSASVTVTNRITANLQYGNVNGGNYSLSAYTGAVASLTAPGATLVASTTIGSVVHAALTAPSPTLSACTGASAQLSAPGPVLTASATVGSVISVSVTAPRPNLVGYGGIVCNVSVTGSPTLQASMTTGAVVSAALVCPLFELVATVSSPTTISANLIAPSPEMGRVIQAWLTAPSAKLVAIGTATITATYEAYAVNLGHRPRVTNQEIPINEVTHYTNFPFTHVVRYQNSYFGANETGLYLLEGTTDAGTPIPWAMKTAMDDFKAPVKKTVNAAYFGGRFGPASTVQLHAGEATPVTYSYSTPRDALAQNHRQVFGKGTKERYFALGASGTGTCELDTVELETYNTTRRI